MTRTKIISFVLCFTIFNLFAADYRIPPEKVAQFLGTAARGQCYTSTAYAYDETISLLVRQLNDPNEAGKKETFSDYNLAEFTENVLKQVMHKSMFDHPNAQTLTQDDFLIATQGYCGGESIKRKKLACIMLIANNEKIKLQTFKNIFPLEEIRPISPVAQPQFPEAFSVVLSPSLETPRMVINLHTNQAQNPTAHALELLATAEDADALCVSFKPHQWERETDFRPFMKPLPYPIMCDEFRKGFKIGAFSALGFALALKNIPVLTQQEHTPLLTPAAALAIAFCTIPILSDHQRPYDRFFNTSTEVTTEFSRNPALSEHIFNIAVALRATEKDRRQFYELYKKLREKLDNNEPYDAEEFACDKLLSHWQDTSSHRHLLGVDWEFTNAVSCVPVHMTRRVHNQLYDEAIAGIQKARLIQGFIAGTSIALPITLLQMLVIYASSI